MRKQISVEVSESEDRWEKVSNDKLSDKQRRYFFAVGAARQGKEGDGYIEVNYSKIPKKKTNESYQDYDSVSDAKQHISIIRNTLSIMISELENRAEHHDESKLSEPEKSGYDKYIPLLQKYKYGTSKYEQVRKDMYEEVLKHHFSNNRHHPEHFNNGIRDMTLVDVFEMFCDWYSASLRSDTGFDEGIKLNQKKFGMSDELTKIMVNTYNSYFK